MMETAMRKRIALGFQRGYKWTLGSGGLRACNWSFEVMRLLTLYFFTLKALRKLNGISECLLGCLPSMDYMSSRRA